MIHKNGVPDAQRAETTVLVYADVDWISDTLGFQRNIFGVIQATNDNHKLFLNSVDHLLGSRDLMRVRPRGDSTARSPSSTRSRPTQRRRRSSESVRSEKRSTGFRKSCGRDRVRSRNATRPCFKDGCRTRSTPSTSGSRRALES